MYGTQQASGEGKEGTHVLDSRSYFRHILLFGLAWSTVFVLVVPEVQARQHTSEVHKTIIVTAYRIAEEVSEVSRSTVVIPEEVIRRSPADNVVGLIKRYGIQSFETGGASYGNEGVVMRGGKSSAYGFDLSGDVLFLVDGRRVGTDNFAALGLDNVERVEIVRGPGSVQYGAGASAGVINVITKRGRERTTANLEAGLADFGLQRYNGFVSGRVGKLDMAAWGSWTASDDYTDGRGRTVDNSAVGYQVKGGFNVGWNFSNRNRLGVSFNGMEGHRMENGPSRSKTYSDQYQNRDYYMGEVLYEGATDNDVLAWTTRYYFGRTGYNLNREVLDGATGARLGRERYSDNTNEIQGAQALLHYAGTESFRLTGGMDLLHYDMEQNQPANRNTPAERANATVGTYLNVGVFVLGKLHLLEDGRLTLSAAGRYDMFKVDLDTEFGIGTPAARTRNIKADMESFVPAFGMAWNPWDFFKVRANYGEGFRSPTPRELGGVYSMGSNILYVGNPDLKPEKSRTWDVGVDVNHGGIKASLTFFDTRYRDMIATLPKNADNERVYANLESAHVQGLEGSFGIDLGERFGWSFLLEPYVSFTHLSTFEDGDRQKLNYFARNSASWGVNYEDPEQGLSAGLDFTYYDKRVDGDDYTSGGAVVADFSLNKRLATFDNGGELGLKFVVRNLFNKYYASYLENIMPGRSVYVGLRYEY